MKISELLVELEKVMWQEGDLDVWATFGCGCCESEDPPELVVRKEKYYKEGLHLN